MKKTIILLMLTSQVALGIEPPTHPLEPKKFTGFEDYENSVSYYCQLDTVYMVKSNTHYQYQPTKRDDVVAASSSMTLVWDQKNNRPYRCDEFKEYRDKVMAKYTKEYEEYERSKPPRKPTYLKR